MTGSNPISQTGCNTFQLMEFCLTHLKSILEFHNLLMHINDLHNSISFTSPLHFGDDTGLLNIQHSIRAINKTLNKDLRELSFWLNANKIALNIKQALH